MDDSDGNRSGPVLRDLLDSRELARVEEIRRGVLQGGERSLLQFGVSSQGKVAGVADAILAQVRGRDARQVGESLSALLDAVGAIDVGSLAVESPLASIPWIGGMFGAVRRFARRYEKLSTQVGRVVAELDRARTQLLRDMVQLDGLAEKNGENLRDLELHILAGRRLLEEVGRVSAGDGSVAGDHGAAVDGEANHQGGAGVDGAQVPAYGQGDGRADIAAFSDAAAASAVSFDEEVREFRDRLGRRIHDLELSRMVAIQTAAQVRLVQGNNQILVEKIQSSILNTIPMWKSQIVIALSLFRQRKALEVQGQVADATGELLRRNAEMLRQSTVDAARESERGIVSIEALRQVNGELVTTIEETLRIQREGRARRREVEEELRRLEAELRDRLREAAVEPRGME